MVQGFLADAWTWTWDVAWVWTWDATKAYFSWLYVWTITISSSIWAWYKQLTLQDFYLFIGSISIIAAWFIGLSTILWALEGWELISLDWARSIGSFFKDVLIKFIELEFVERPLVGVQNVLAALSADKRFDTDNEGFIIMFIWFVYPIIWNFTVPSALVNVLVLPIFIALYIIDSDLFIDQAATDLAEDGRIVPKEGLPTSFAKAYNIHSLLWGNYTYLEDKDLLRIDLTQMVMYLWFSIVQLAMSFLLEPILWVWSILSTFSLSSIIFYEIFFLELSFYDAPEGDQATAL